MNYVLLQWYIGNLTIIVTLVMALGAAAFVTMTLQAYAEPNERYDERA